MMVEGFCMTHMNLLGNVQEAPQMPNSPEDLSQACQMSKCLRLQMCLKNELPVSPPSSFSRPVSVGFDDQIESQFAEIVSALDFVAQCWIC